MYALLRAFISGRYRNLFQALVWGAMFFALLVIGYGFVRWQISNQVHRDQDSELGRLAEIHENVVTALHMLQRDTTGAPCSREFMAEMQRVAFLPDGLNEFLYAPKGQVKCSTSQPVFVSPVELGAPDIDERDATSPALWIDRDLAPLGRSAARGTIAELGPFAVAIPPYHRFANDWSWLEKQLVIVGPHRKVWNVAGDQGLYQRVLKPTHFDLLSRLTSYDVSQCDEQGRYCVASRADMILWAGDWLTILSSILVLAGIFAWISAANVLGWLRRYWSFEARFSRHLTSQSIEVVYQPIIDLRSGRVSGCEVLARWRDVDGTVVAPDRFIDIVARTGRTKEFTRLVVDRAYGELTTQLPQNSQLQISFNIFACDLDSATLLPIFSAFAREGRNFDLAVELVENQNLNFADAQRAILELAQAGIKVYIDDFGIGYSSIERVATLAVHGVKLDRSFAMSPSDSVLGRMLVQVLEMINTVGSVVIIEGVETEARLNLLRSTGLADYVQGYAISRPLSIGDFTAFLSTYGIPSEGSQPVVSVRSDPKDSELLRLAL
jgi:sensor c-di-GMP phosphodiesterase-like protein